MAESASTPLESPPEWKIAPNHIPGLPPLVVVGEEGLTLGRDPGNDVVLDGNLYPGVSAHHVRLWVEEAALFLEDLDSKNGTLVGGEPIEARPLRNGESFELGSGGPRFTVLSDAGLDETVRVPQQAARRSVGPETVRLVQAELGLPEQGEVEALVERRGRRNFTFFALFLLATLGLGWWGFAVLSSRDEAAAVTLEEKTRALEEELSRQERTYQEALADQHRAWLAQSEELRQAGEAWEAEKTRLERESKLLQASLAAREENERGTAGEIAELRARLEETNRSLQRYDPVNLEKATLREVSRVERSVCLIEVEQTFRDEDGNELFVDETPFGVRFNLEGKGERFERSSSGSGFSLTPDGWILTNAHVVLKKGEEAEEVRGPEGPLVTLVSLKVVFSGRSRRHPARLVGWASEDSKDLALIKIKPFEGMPYLEGLDLAIPTPPRGTDVFLLGFPLGKQALQEGERVIASTFRGILSREVDYYLQVDAAVHPGNSGGPLIDAQGRVLGVVVGLQTVDEIAGSSAIGYIIPIAEARDLWPPPTE